MSEDDDKKLDFSLPKHAPEPPLRTHGKLTLFLVVVLLLIVGGNTYLTWKQPPADSGSSPARRGGLPAEGLKQLALKLEKQGLNNAAAGVWQEYLESAEGDDVNPSAIWYRIGTLYQGADSHEMALEAFYRSESLGESEELSSEIGRRVQESLEALGKFAALKHELSERVGLNDDAGAPSGEVLAEIGPQKITREELDRQIEASIENQLAMFASQMTDEQRKQQKEAMLKQFAGDQQRLQFLNSYIVQEILYRKARESKLVEDPAVRAQLRDAERNLLARQMMETEMSGKIYITDGDIALYYDARKANYMEPATAKLSHIVVADEESATKVIERILAGEEFATLAKELSTDAETKEKGGEIATAAVQGQGIAGLNLPAGALDPLFAAKAGDILDVPVKSEAGFHVFQVREQTPERQKPLEEVRQQIYAELYRQKERDVQAKLLEDLRDEFDVVIHQEAFKGAAPNE